MTPDDQIDYCGSVCRPTARVFLEGFDNSATAPLLCLPNGNELTIASIATAFAFLVHWISPIASRADGPPSRKAPLAPPCYKALRSPDRSDHVY